MGKGGYMIGLALIELKDGNYWQLEAQSFEEYTEMAHGIKKSRAYGLMGMVEKYGKQLENNSPAEPSRLIRLLPFTTPEKAEELYYMALNTPARAFEDNIRNLKNKPGRDECDHDWAPCRICRKCGKVGKVKEGINE
jgi:hypothetical protein